MKNTFKRIVICLLTVVLCLGVALFAVACNPDSDDSGNGNYIIKVVYPDGTAVTTGTGGPNEDQLQVQVCVDADGGACSIKVAVDANGTATFTADKLPTLPAGAKYHIVLSGLPEGYTYNATAENLYVDSPVTVTVTLSEAGPQTVAYTLTAKDTNDAPLVGAPFEIYAYNPSNSSQTPTLAQATTDSDGVAIFNIVPSDNENLQYKVRQSTGFPYKYEIAANQDKSFDSERKMLLTYKYYPNAFSFGDTARLNYKRTPAAQDGEPSVTYTPLQFSLKDGVYEYFYFNPYDETSTATNDNKSAAASGTYNIKFTVSGNAGVTMKQFSGSASYVPQNPETKIPSIVLREVTNPNEGIVVELSASDNNMSIIFGIVAEGDCSVTISVERTGDYSYVIPTPVITTIEPSSTPQNVGNGDLETGNAISLNTTSIIVKDANGIYHVGSENGPIVYAVLNKVIPYNGFAEYSFARLIDLANPETNPDEYSLYASIFRITTARDSKGHATAIDDYIEMMGAYCDATQNTEGLYPLNDDIKNFLENYVSSSISTQPNLYLCACKYFSQDIVQAEKLNSGANSVTFTETDVNGFGRVFRVTSVNGGNYTLGVSVGNTNVTVCNPDEPTEVFIGQIDRDGQPVNVYMFQFVMEAGQSRDFLVRFGEAGTETLTLSGGNDPVEDNTDLALGDNDISVSPDEVYNGKEYIFTAPETGWYLLSVDGSNENILIFDDGEAVIDASVNLLEYKFYLEEGAGMYFYMSWVEIEVSEAVTYSVNFATTAAPQPSSIGLNGGNVNMALSEFILEVSEAGTYSLTFDVGMQFGRDIIVLRVGNGANITVSPQTNFIAAITVTDDDIVDGAVVITIVQGVSAEIPVTVQKTA